MLQWNQNFINKNKENPKRIFLIDAIGAFVSMLVLLGILAPLEDHFGMPKEILYFLSGIAACLFIYSISCQKLVKSNWKSYLAVLIVCNIIYSLISVGMIVWHAGQLTKLGWIYFVLELPVIGLVVSMEYKSYWVE